MQRASRPALAGLLQEALDRGQLVVIRSVASPPRNTESPLVMTCSLRFGLTHAESRALVTLMQHEHVSKQALHAAISSDGSPVSQIKLVDVVVCHLRKKLKPHDITIGTLRGQGYTLDREARAKIKQITGYNTEGVTTAPKTDQQVNAENS
jgi:DNA-binding response OmpR family regulator